MAGDVGDVGEHRAVGERNNVNEVAADLGAWE